MNIGKLKRRMWEAHTRRPRYEVVIHCLPKEWEMWEDKDAVEYDTIKCKYLSEAVASYERAVVALRKRVEAGDTPYAVELLARFPRETVSLASEAIG